jgi:hypothetical protein
LVKRGLFPLGFRSGSLAVLAMALLNYHVPKSITGIKALKVLFGVIIAPAIFSRDNDGIFVPPALIERNFVAVLLGN